MKYGYLPFDIIKGESISRTLEYVYDDYCAMRFAEALGRKEDAAYFAKRADFYNNVLDPETKFMRGKDSKGNWRTPFDPYELGHGADTANDYTEGNAWQYTWHVQHDPEGLVKASWWTRRRPLKNWMPCLKRNQNVKGRGLSWT